MNLDVLKVTIAIFCTLANKLQINSRIKVKENKSTIQGLQHLAKKVMVRIHSIKRTNLAALIRNAKKWTANTFIQLLIPKAHQLIKMSNKLLHKIFFQADTLKMVIMEPSNIPLSIIININNKQLMAMEWLTLLIHTNQLFRFLFKFHNKCTQVKFLTQSKDSFHNKLLAHLLEEGKYKKEFQTI